MARYILRKLYFGLEIVHSCIILPWYPLDVAVPFGVWMYVMRTLCSIFHDDISVHLWDPIIIVIETMLSFQIRPKVYKVHEFLLYGRSLPLIINGWYGHVLHKVSYKNAQVSWHTFRIADFLSILKIQSATACIFLAISRLWFWSSSVVKNNG